MTESFYEYAAENMLELASDQRLEILFLLNNNNFRTTQIAREIGSSKQEIHRHLTRLSKTGFIYKDMEGGFNLTTFGQAICTQMPTLKFFINHRDYLEDHNFGDMPEKFVIRIGQLREGKFVKGYSRIMERCMSIYKNAKEHIYEVMGELSLDRIPVVFDKTKKQVLLSYIAPETAIVPRGRRDLLEKMGLKKLMDRGLVERKMRKQVQTMVVLNEKEAMVMLPRMSGEHDFTAGFYSDSELFHNWCLDYFKYCWQTSGSWIEGRLQE